MQDFEEIYAQYYALVFKYVMSLCQQPSLAEEIAQETFFRACKSIDSFKETAACAAGSARSRKTVISRMAGERS